MRLFKENERVVYIGDTMEHLSWGWVQFPKLYPMKNGNIGMYIHDDDDSWVCLDGDTAGKWLVTEDDAISWRPATKEDKDMMGTQLPNGDVLRSMPNPPESLTGVEDAPWSFATYHLPTDHLIPQKPEDQNQLPFPITTYSDIFGSRYRVYWLDSIHDHMIEKRFCFHRLKHGEIAGGKVYAEVDWNYRTTVSFPPSHASRKDLESVMLNNAGLYTCRDVKVAPDGSLFIAHYRGNGANPFTGVYEGTTNAYILHSDDNGETWQLRGYIPYKEPDEEHDVFAHLKSGFSEPNLAFMPDGSILCVLRTCDVFRGAPEWGPTYLSRSEDNGYTWSKPEFFRDRGALPQLLQLDNGVTLAVITRPGIYVYASCDCGHTWTDAIEVMTDADRSVLANDPPARPNFHQWAGSCCNCTILPTAENRALLAFSDFYVADDAGVKHKGIKTIEIVADLDA